MKAKNLSRGWIFLLVSMVTAVIAQNGVVVSADKTWGQNSNPNSKETQEDYSSEENLDENETLEDFNSGDLAFEREKKKHKLVITKDEEFPSWRFVECHGENIKSLSAISCHSMEVCEEKKACLLHGQNCRSDAYNRSEVSFGMDCLERARLLKRFGFSHYKPINPSNSTCFTLLIRNSNEHGIVQCTSEEAGANLTTFDHYSVGDINDSFLSSVKNVTSDFIKMKLFVSGLTQDLNDRTTFGEGNVRLYVDEEVSLVECIVPPLIFHKEGFIRIYRKDGTTVKLGPEWWALNKYAQFPIAKLKNFQVPADVIAFSCAAQRTNSSGQWMEQRINVTVRDYPSEVNVKSNYSTNRTVNLTLGSEVNLHCELTGNSELKSSIRRRWRENWMEDYYYQTDTISNSMAEFLRLHQVAGENLICKDLDKNYSSAPRSKWKIEHATEFGNECNNHFVFQFGPKPIQCILLFPTNVILLAPSAPKIYKSSPSVFVNYVGSHTVNQTLFCLFTGQPEPLITLTKNGEEFPLNKSFGILHPKYYESVPFSFSRLLQENHTGPTPVPVKVVRLQLDATIIEPGDFKLGESQVAHLNFSCIAQNSFGSDRLDFIIIKNINFSSFSTKTDSSCTTLKTTTAVLALLFLMTLFIIGYLKRKSAESPAAETEIGMIFTYKNHDSNNPNPSPHDSMKSILINDE